MQSGMEVHVIRTYMSYRVGWRYMSYVHVIQGGIEVHVIHAGK
jgi:hypothetical protein